MIASQTVTPRQLTQSNSSSTIKQILNCKLCHQQATNTHMCSSCHKFYCQNCIKTWLKAKQNHCPSCNEIIHINSLIRCEKLTYELSQALSSFNISNDDNCSLFCRQHEMTKNYFCLTCKEPLCSDCSILTSQHEGHSFDKLQNVKRKYHDKLNIFLQKIFQKKTQLAEKITNFRQQQSQLLHKQNFQLQKLKSHMKYFEEKISTKIDSSLKQTFQMTQCENQQLKTLNNVHSELVNQLLKVGKSQLLSKVGKKIENQLAQKQLQYQRFLDNNRFKDWKIPYEFHESQLLPKYSFKKFILDNYTYIRQKKGFLYSQIFFSDGLEWRLKIYPNGVSQNQRNQHEHQQFNPLKNKRSISTDQSKNIKSQQYISIFIQLQKGLRDFGIYQHKIEIVNQKNKQLQIKRQFENEFESGQCWGYNNFAKIQTLYEQGYVHPTQDFLEIILYVGPPTFYHSILDENQTIKNKQNLVQHNKNKISFLRQKIASKPQKVFSKINLNIKNDINNNTLQQSKSFQNLTTMNIGQIENETPKILSQNKIGKNVILKNYANYEACVKNFQSDEDQGQIDTQIMKTYLKSQHNAKCINVQ